MNPQQLLAHYDKIADAPDAVERLRRFILDMAVRGKLVPQSSQDEAASTLLERIVAKNLQQTDANKPSSRKGPSAGVDVPFQLPTTWCWTQLGVVADYGQSRKVNSNRELSRNTWVLDLVDIEKDSSRLLQRVASDQRPFRSAKTVFAKGDVLLGKLRPYLNKVVVAQEDGVCTTEIVPIRGRGATDPSYLALVLRSPLTMSKIESLMYGMKMPRLGTSDGNALPVPLPPLFEQVRIVAKVDELMALCDQLKAARTKREATRERLGAASLARLRSPDSETFTADARFALDALPSLTARSDQIEQLRQTILNLAVRGKLLAQDSTEESAVATINRLGRLPDPARYAKRSPELIPGDCGLSINLPSIPIPMGWSWVPLVQIARLESGHTPSRNRPDWWGGDVPWIGLVDARIHNNGKIFETIQYTNEAGLANSAARLLPAGTVCFSRTASVGYVVVMGRPMATSQDFVNWVPTESLSSEWLQLVMIAERPAIPRFSKGAVHQTIYYPAWLSMHIALPPLAEQRRIVAKVDELMGLCDQLENSLTSADDTRRRLLDAMLAEALQPALQAAA